MAAPAHVNLTCLIQAHEAAQLQLQGARLNVMEATLNTVFAILPAKAGGVVEATTRDGRMWTAKAPPSGEAGDLYAMAFSTTSGNVPETRTLLQLVGSRVARVNFNNTLHKAAKRHVLAAVEGKSRQEAQHYVAERLAESAPLAGSVGAGIGWGKRTYHWPEIMWGEDAQDVLARKYGQQVRGAMPGGCNAGGGVCGVGGWGGGRGGVTLTLPTCMRKRRPTLLCRSACTHNQVGFRV